MKKLFTNYKNFINENLNSYMTLKNYFESNCKLVKDIIGLEVYDDNNNTYYVVDTDGYTNEQTLPISLFISKIKGSNIGHYEFVFKLNVKKHD